MANECYDINKKYLPYINKEFEKDGIKSLCNNNSYCKWKNNKCNPKQNYDEFLNLQ
tara:strand:+ start:691 stop:858 length:168 start_codon:yes stop_codon:yes gene_type:complete